ncbi:hypothetical protein B0H14DRAFT_2594955 [Mycena olivaceomarginata]|nr:hypothetical protein B0H14DRAFT_2594955 [Mycena olivaceomarginata]
MGMSECESVKQAESGLGTNYIWVQKFLGSARMGQTQAMRERESRRAGEEELSSVLVNSKMGRSSGIWGVRVNEKSRWGGPEKTRRRGIGIWWKIGDVPCGREKVFTGSVLVLEYSSHWPRHAESVHTGERWNKDAAIVGGIRCRSMNEGAEELNARGRLDTE